MMKCNFYPLNSYVHALKTVYPIQSGAVEAPERFQRPKGYFEMMADPGELRTKPDLMEELKESQI